MVWSLKETITLFLYPKEIQKVRSILTIYDFSQHVRWVELNHLQAQWLLYMDYYVLHLALLVHISMKIIGYQFLKDLIVSVQYQTVQSHLLFLHTEVFNFYWWINYFNLRLSVLAVLFMSTGHVNNIPTMQCLTGISRNTQ